MHTNSPFKIRQSGHGDARSAPAAAWLAVLIAALLGFGRAAGAQPGGTTTLIADVDGDGTPDTVEIEAGFDPASPRHGTAVAISGATGATLYTIQGPSANDWFGHAAHLTALQPGGPMELLITSPAAPGGQQGGTGIVYAYSASSGAFLRSIPAPAGARLGIAVDSIPDQDGDGWREIVTEGATGGPPWLARTLVFSGRTGALLAVRAATMGGIKRFAEAGGRVYVAADVNDSGVVDVHDIAGVASGLVGPTDPRHDVNGDGVVDAADLTAVVEAMLRGDRSIVSSAVVTEVAGEAEGMQSRWAGVHGAAELDTSWSFATNLSGPGESESGGTGSTNSTGEGGGTLPGLQPCNCGSIGSGSPPPGPDCTAQMSGCPGQSVPINTVVVLQPLGPSCTFAIDGVPLQSPYQITSSVAGCVTVKMQCTDGSCCACQECTICFYDPIEPPPCEVSVGFVQCPGCGTLESTPVPIDRLGSFVVGAVGNPPGGVYDWSIQLYDECNGCQGTCPSCPDGCEPNFNYTTADGFLLLSEHPSFSTLTPTDGQYLWIRVRYRMDDEDCTGNCCDGPLSCCHAVATCKVALYVRDCSIDTDGDTFCDCEEDALGTLPNDPLSRPAARLIDADLDAISRLNDVVGPLEYSQLGTPQPYLERFDTDGDGVQDLAEFELSLNPDLQYTASGVYDRYSPQNMPADLDQDLVYDVYEVRVGLDPTVRDTDGDEIVDGVELRRGTDPRISHRHESPDSDGDGLSDYEEVVIYRTDLDFYDTDGDGLSDFFEVRAGLDPLLQYSNARIVYMWPPGGGSPTAYWIPGPHDLTGDTDLDGVTNQDEEIYGTDPTLPDTDGDGVSDGAEIEQGSDPNDPGDGGVAPDPDELVDVLLEVGDDSGSHSERWSLRVGPIRYPAPTGQVVSRSFKLRRGRSYPINLIHRGSVVTPPDYDYTARVTIASSGHGYVDDPAVLLGEYGNIDWPVVRNKTATLYLPVIDIRVSKPAVIDSTMPEIPQDDELTTGVQTFVNLDNDDQDPYFDIDDNTDGVADDDELVPVRLRINPVGATPGPVRLVVTGGSHIRFWNDANKTSALDPTQPLPYPSSFANNERQIWVEGIDAHTVQRGTTITLEYTQTRPVPYSNLVFTDGAAVTVLGVTGVEWIGQSNSITDTNLLDQDPNWPPAVGLTGYTSGSESLRVFPDARLVAGAVEPNARNKVTVRVTLSTPPVESLDVYIRAFDVDDPTSDARPIDEDTGSGRDQDNRGTPQSGTLAGQLPNGTAAVHFDVPPVGPSLDFADGELTVCMQPGDNFRAVANVDADYLVDLHNDDTVLGSGAADKLCIVNAHVLAPAGGPVATPVMAEVREAGSYVSPVLTAWRILNLEVDSMASVANNFVDTEITALSPSGSLAAIQATVATTLRDGSDDLDSFSSGAGRFESGSIRIAGAHTIGGLNGNGTARVVRTSGLNVCATPLPFQAVNAAGTAVMNGTVTQINGTFTFVVAGVSYGGAPPPNWSSWVGGAVTISGGTAMSITSANMAALTLTVSTLRIPVRIMDDDAPDGTAIPRPDMSRVAPAFARAFIVPREGVLSGDETLPFMANIPTHSGSVDLGWSFNNQPNHELGRCWIVYIRTAFQDEDMDDNDSNGEGLSWGVTDVLSGRGFNLYDEAHRDYSPFSTINLPGHGFLARDTVVHELGHCFGCRHREGGVMGDDDPRAGDHGPFDSIDFKDESLATIRAEVAP